MRPIIRALPLLCVLGALAFARAQDKAADPQAEYDALQAQFRAAQQEYYKPYQEAKTPEESKRIQLDPTKDPRRSFRPKFEELARRAKGSEPGCRAWTWVYSNAQDDAQAQLRAIDAMGDYVGSPAVEGFVLALGWTPPTLGADKVAALEERILKESPHADVRAAVLFSQASSVFENPDSPGAAKEAARARLKRVLEEFGKTRYAPQANGLLFEADHLQIGMVPPEFSAVDQDGKPWKLGDYRGKVVVLDFWGYW